MEEYISKSALVAELEKRQKEEVSYDEDGSFASWADQNHYSTLESIKDFINTLEVKEVDLEKEINEHWDEWAKEDGFHSIDFAKHFFELGLRSTITEEDCKLIWNIGDEIPNMPEEEFFKELLRRFKTQKGE